MKTLTDYIAESKLWHESPSPGDKFAIVIREECLIESYVLDSTKNAVVIYSDQRLLDLLESYKFTLEEISVDDVLAEQFSQAKADAYNRAITQGKTPEQAEQLAGITDADSNFYEIDHTGKMIRLRIGSHPRSSEISVPSAVDLYNDELDEAEYQGREVPLSKPMRGDVKKFKVYVKDPKTGNIKKVNFGHGGSSARRAGQETMRIKKSNPERRRSFRARHNCDNPGPKTKARYWSCRAW